MGTWFLSILLMGVFSVVCGYAVYGITWLTKKRDKDLGEMSGGFSGFAIAILSVVFIFFSMMNSCTSKYTTYEESITDSLPAYFIIVGIIVVGFIVWFFISNKKQHDTKEREEKQFIEEHGMTREEHTSKVIQEKRLKQQEKQRQRSEFLKSLSGKYGKGSTSFTFSKSSHNSKECEARVFEDKRVIVVFKPLTFSIVDTIPFSSILDFSVDEEVKVIGGNTATTTTKTSTGSMVKRGLVGGVLLGGVGALAGAATAKQSSQTIFDEKREERLYSIRINIDSISSPIYTMCFGLDSNACQKVAGLLTVIIKRNSQPIADNHSNQSAVITNDIIEPYTSKDPLYDEIASFAVSQSSISAPLLQRRFGIGYKRAGEIIAMLELKGVVEADADGRYTISAIRAPQFQCSVCGYVHEGDNVPQNCPLCNAPQSRFKMI